MLIRSLWVDEYKLRDDEMPLKENCPPRQQPDKKSKNSSNDAFELWLKRGLHQLFDDVANEPVPDELLRLIENDRERKK